MTTPENTAEPTASDPPCPVHSAPPCPVHHRPAESHRPSDVTATGTTAAGTTAPSSTPAASGTPRVSGDTSTPSAPTPPTTTHGWAARTGVIRLIALLVMVAWFVIGGTGGQLVGKLSSLQKNDNATLLPADVGSSLARDELAKFQTSSGFPYLIVFYRDGGITPADRAAVQAFATDVPQLRMPGYPDGVTGTIKHSGQPDQSVTVTTFADVLKEVPKGALPSEDGKALLLPVTLKSDVAALPLGKTTGIALTKASLSEALDQRFATSGLTHKITGPAGFISDFAKAFAGIDGLLLIVALVVVLIILLIVYRSPILPIAVLLSALFGLSLAGLVVYPVAAADLLTVNGQSQGILFILVIGAATDYALLLVARYREELHDYERPFDAMKAAWRGTVEPILASGVTVILGLLCLLLSDLGSNRSLGPVAALGIVGALASALTFLPAVLVLIGRRVFWPMIPRVDHRHEDMLHRGGVWGKVADAVAKHPRRIWATTAVVLIAAAVFVPTFKADGVSTADVFRTTTEAVEGNTLLEAHFPGGTGAPTQLVTPVGQAEKVKALVASTPGVKDAQIGTAPVPGVPPKVVDGRVIVQATLTDNSSSIGAIRTIEALRERIATSDLAVKPHVGGPSAQTADLRMESRRDLIVVLPAILLMVFLVLIVLLRSVVAPLILVLANTVSFLATMGVSALVFNHLFQFPGADAATPLYGFVFLIALGVDYSIFLMTRVREETPKRGTRDATVVGLAATGGVITSAGIVLAATFSALVVLPLVFMAQIAFIVAFGVLLDTFVVRSLLVPGLVRDLGRVVWWPSKLDRSPPPPTP